MQRPGQRRRSDEHRATGAAPRPRSPARSERSPGRARTAPARCAARSGRPAAPAAARPRRSRTSRHRRPARRSRRSARASRTSSRIASEPMPSGSRPISTLRISPGEPGTANTDRYLATIQSRLARVVSAVDERRSWVWLAVMSIRETPPFRADHVGSLLRPPELTRARARWRAGEIDADSAVGDRERRDRRRDRVAAQHRSEDGDRRGVPAHVLAHGLHLLAGRDRAGARASGSTFASTATRASTTTSRRLCTLWRRSR